MQDADEGLAFRPECHEGGVSLVAGEEGRLCWGQRRGQAPGGGVPQRGRALVTAESCRRG
jgi:hypothetical protein